MLNLSPPLDKVCVLAGTSVVRYANRGMLCPREKMNKELNLSIIGYCFQRYLSAQRAHLEYLLASLQTDIPMGCCHLNLLVIVCLILGSLIITPKLITPRLVLSPNQALMPSAHIFCNALDFTMGSIQ